MDVDDRKVNENLVGMKNNAHGPQSTQKRVRLVKIRSRNFKSSPLKMFLEILDF